MNEFEYRFLTGSWDGPKGAAYNQTFEFCRNFGWCVGFDQNGRPVTTKKGAQMVRDYALNNRIDVV